MITLLNNTHEKIMSEYLKAMPMYALYFTTHFDSLDNADFYGCFDDDELVCIFSVMYNTLFIFSGSSNLPVNEINGFLTENKLDFMIMRGQESVLKQFECLYSFTTKHSTLLCKLSKSNFTPVENKGRIVCATRANIDELQGFFNGIDEFRGMFSYDTIADFVCYGYTFLLYDGSDLASVVICNKKNKSIANISNIATLPEHRNKGYATSLLSYVCDILLQECDSVCLCHEYEYSDKIHKTLGFDEIGFIAMYVK